MCRTECNVTAVTREPYQERIYCLPCSVMRWLCAYNPKSHQPLLMLYHITNFLPIITAQVSFIMTALWRLILGESPDRCHFMQTAVFLLSLILQTMLLSLTTNCKSVHTILDLQEPGNGQIYRSPPGINQCSSSKVKIELHQLRIWPSVSNDGKSLMKICSKREIPLHQSRLWLTAFHCWMRNLAKVSI